MKSTFFFCFLFSISNVFGQILFQDFESGLGSWETHIYSNGSLNITPGFTGIVSAYQGYIPQNGGGMYRMGFAKSNTSSTSQLLISPQFTLPAGTKYISFWVLDEVFSINYLDVYLADTNTTKLTYILMNATPLLSNLDPLTNGAWTKLSYAIPSGYLGNKYLYFLASGNVNFDHSSFALFDDIEITTSNPNSIEMLSPQDFKVYSSSQQYGQIKIAFAKDCKNTAIRILNLEGKVVLEKTGNFTSNENVAFDVQFSTGLYFVEIANEGNRIVKKVFVD